MENDAVLRIGEVSKRSGVSPELLRAWERRYGLLRPERSSGGLRLYSPGDVERVRLMRQHLARGLAAAEAAALASRGTGLREGPPPALSLGALRADLAAALDRFDEPAAQEVMDEVLAAATVDAALTEVVLPYLHDLGERWARGEASIAQEHFAVSVIRGRLLGLARGWGRGLGPLALLACLPGEQHELGLIAFGLTLRARGWRIGYLGSDTPLDTVERAAATIEPAFVVLTAVTPERLQPLAGQLQRLGARHRLGLGGMGAAEADPSELGALALAGDPAEEAERVTALVHVPDAAAAARAARRARAQSDDAGA